MTEGLRIGIDLGGTKIEGAAIDASGSLRARRRVATPANRYRATIETIIALIGAIEQEKNVMAWVQDHGIGIPTDKLQKVFEEFYQIEPPNTRRYGGLGIGLTIAKGLIEVQGGKIWAESEGPSTGATLKVVLPKVA